MTADLENYVLRENLIREFDEEALKLLWIAHDAGDNLADAKKWVAADTEIQKLYDEIYRLGGFPDATATANREEN